MYDKLLTIAKQYSSKEEFKTKDLVNFIKAKRLRVLIVAFPPNRDKIPKRGIYYLYKGNRIVKIGYTFDNIAKAIESDKYRSSAQRYRYYSIVSDADILTMYIYLVAKYRPEFNTDVPKQKLSYSIPFIKDIIGESTTGVFS